MLHLIHQGAFFAHIFAGSVALITFWLPFFTHKGDKNHKRFGQLYSNGMYLVALSGIIMSTLVLTDPIAIRNPNIAMSPQQLAEFTFDNRVFASFLFMLSILAICNVRQAILVLRAKQQRTALKTPLHLALQIFLGIIGLVVAWVGFTYQVILLQIFSVLCIVTSLRNLHYIFKPALKQREWIIAHLGNICAGGIATYTAFLAFGGSRLLSHVLSGNLQIIPWVLPGIIGTIAISKLSYKYQQQYKVA